MQICNAGCIGVTEYLSVYKFNGIINFKLSCDINPHRFFFLLNLKIKTYVQTQIKKKFHYNSNFCG